MIINRHNYEELFLLYVDNELNKAEKEAVEQFVQQNPDLAEEMEMLKQAVLPGENIEFEQKEVLYNKPEGIALNNYEEYFLLAVDNELTQTENEEVEKFVLKHPELQDEFTLLEQTRLQPEEIIYTEKEKLYKKEGKEKPVIFLTWMRVSVAAAIVGLIAMTWFLTQNNGHTPANSFTSVPKNSIKKLPATAETVKQDSQAIDRDVASIQPKIPANAEAEIKTKVIVRKGAEPNVKKEEIAVNVVKNKQPESLVSKVKDDKMTAAPAQDKKAFEQAIASARIDSRNSNVIKDDAKDVKFANKPSEQNAPLAAQAVYREIDTQENEEENTFYIGSAEINKTKLKGLFKKATRLFERKNNNNDGERTLKIAGFEIKSK
ncbi:MAG: hypothetical protein JWR18_1044 [Segetibacter sp.]|nr:hypothetical protein [Segetibacter sp.]